MEMYLSGELHSPHQPFFFPPSSFSSHTCTCHLCGLLRQALRFPASHCGPGWHSLLFFMSFSYPERPALNMLASIFATLDPDKTHKRPYMSVR